jgi:hypothetical protein
MGAILAERPRLHRVEEQKLYREGMDNKIENQP